MAGLIAVALAGCARSGEPGRESGDMKNAAAETTFAIPVEWLADSARDETLPVAAPPEVWVTRVAPSRAAAPDPPLPEALPEVPETLALPPALEIDPGLKPPIPRRAARIAVPHGASRAAHVELDVEVGTDGAVKDVLWAGGSRDAALVAAAIDCARSMSFFPAMRGAEPVAVWCRQRFDFVE